MRLSRLLVLFATLLTFSNTELFSQISNLSFAPVYSQDSLQGFDEAEATKTALAEGLLGNDLAKAVSLYKRQFVMNKYNLHENYIPKNNSNSQSWLGKYSSSTINAAPCVNEGFESGSASGWSVEHGTNFNSTAYPATTTGTTAASQLSVVSLPFNDPIVGTVPVSPFSGNKAIRINDQAANAVVIKLSQTFPITTTNYVFEFAYWAVMEYAGPPNPVHTCTSTPYMQVRFLNDVGNLQVCPSFSIIAPGSGGGCVGVGPLTWTPVTSGITTVQTSTSWQKFSVDLSSVNSSTNQNVTVEIIVGDCNFGGHFGYAYFDSNCNTMNLSVNSTTLSMPSTTVSPQVQCATTATLGAPYGFAPYVWKGPAGSGITSNTNQIISTATPGNYTLEMYPVGICNPPQTKIVNLQFVPPTSLTASPANLCASGSNTASTLSASGAAQYTWMPGGSNSSSIVVTPTVTTIYTLTARTGTCVGTYTLQVTVNPDPVFNVVSSNPSLCPGQIATLTALSTSSNTYVWNPGALTGSVVTVSQSAATIYTTVATSTAGCVSTVTTPIAQSASVTASILVTSPVSALTGSVCAGTAVTMFGLGATPVAWYPGGSTGVNIVVTPSVTTTYTFVGANGSCTGQAVQTISVDPGPGITFNLNPTSTCPGNTTTISATAPAAVGAFTWNPGAINASSIVVTPTLAGGYSVSAANSAGCVNTQTINPNISPTPTVVISPSSASVCSGGSTTLTATGATNYTWMPGGLTGASVVLSPTANTTYTVTGVNGAGCTSQAMVAVTVVSSPTINASASPTAVCAGSCATITPGGAASYTISGGSFVVCPTSNSVYSIVGSNAAGCVSSPINVSVNVNSNPVIGASANPASICAGNTSTLTATGGVTYTWSTGANGSSVAVNPGATQNFTVTGANASGCTSQATVSVVVNSIPNISITPSSSTICPGQNVSPVASGATSYTWFPGSVTGSNPTFTPAANTIYTVIGATGTCTNQNTFTVTIAPTPVITGTFLPGTICPGNCATLSATGGTSYVTIGLTNPGCPTVTTNYTVIGTSAFGCTNSATGTLFVNPAPVIGASSNPAAICPGGSSTLTATGGTSYTWQPGSLTGSSVSVNPAATTVYTVTGASASGCTATATTTVVVNSVPVISVSPSSTTICQGSSVNLTANGAATYTWLPGNLSGSSIVVSPASNTTYTVLGANGSCSGQNTVVVTVAPNPTVNASYTPTTVCAGSCATLNPSGALTYTVTGLSTIACPTITSSYTVIGSNASGCISAPFVGSLPVIAAPNIAASATPTGICAGDSSLVNATGGVSYTWQPGNVNASSFFAKPSLPTVYTVTGANASGCTKTATVNVTVFPAPAVFASANPTAICAGGSATLTGGGATSYFWSPGGLSGANVFVSPGVTTTYTLTGVSGVCTGSTTVTLVVNPAPVVSISPPTATICPGGTASLVASGANTYTWNDGSNSAAKFVSPAVTTTYSVIGTGATGCISNIASITVNVDNSPTISASGTPSSICAGIISTLTTGGGFTNVFWQPGNLPGNTVTVTPASSTIYSVSGIGAGGCTSSATLLVVVGPSVSINASANPSLLCGTGITSTLTATGATNYTWMPGSLTGSSVAVVAVGSTIYTVTGSSGGCSGQATVAVNVVPAPSVSISASSNSICGGSCATLTANGASSYTWSNGSLSANIVVCPTVTTTYSVLGSVGSCTDMATITVFVTGTPTLAIQSSANPICAGATAVLTASGATNYLWSTTSTLSSISVAPPTTSVYTLFGAIGTCTSSTSFTLNVIPAANLTITPTSPTICAGFTVGLLAGGSPAPSYTWQPNNVTINPLVDSPSASTIYTVSSNNSGCISSATISILVIPLPNIGLAANPQTICIGNTTTLTATGGVTYTWIPSLATGSTFTDNPSSNTSYTVVGLGASGCPNYAAVFVNVVPGLNVTAAASNTAICDGGSATLTASGASNYTWMPGIITNSIIVITPTSNAVYTVTGSNGGSCLGSGTIAIQVNPNPTINAIASPTFICIGNTVSLTATGASIYSWVPSGLTGSNVTDNPVTSTTYTVFGVDNNGCSGIAVTSVSVNAMSNIILAANPSSLCLGGSSTLTASGGLSYTWNPGAQSSSSIVVTPAATTIYTLMANDASGCTGTFTLPVTIFPTPTVAISPLNASVCAGSSITLTGSGATNYTWLPGGANTSTIVESPLASTSYTLIGDNGGLCFGSAIVNVFVNPLPAGVTAASHGTVSCTSPTAQLVGSCTDPNVSYSWSGPSGYSSNLQSPLTTGVWGNFTLTVTDTITGCVKTETVDVPSDNSIPFVTAIASGSIGCAITTVTLNAVNTTTNPGYSWNGPSGYTSTVQSPTVSTPGTYTIVVTDLTSNCTGSAVVTVGTHTTVSVTASITPSSCDEVNGVSNNDGSISVSGFTLTDKYDLVSGTSYTGTATYLTAANIPTNGIIASNLANPSVVIAFSIRLFDVEGCTKDTTMYLVPVDCSFRTFGIAKAVSDPEPNTDGSYNLTYTIVAKSYDKDVLTNISLTENLSNTFPAPTTYTVIADSLKTIAGTPLNLNMSFDGSTQTDLLSSSSTNSLLSGDSTVIQFKVKVKPTLFLTDYNNSVIGEATTIENVTMVDSSNTGLDPNPDGDKSPYNNNVPTSVKFLPNFIFGLTKVGEIHKSDGDGFDITYTISVHNLGNDTIRYVNIKDSLFNNTIPNPATYSMRSGPVASGSELVVNSSYDGNTQSYLLDSTQSRMPPNSVRSVYFTINVIPGEITSISNSAYGTAIANAKDPLRLTDVSNSGSNPDQDENGICNEANDNVPTVLLIPNTHTLFIPEGFSPDGDNINQYFVIQGLPTAGNNPITIFNRWGNKVYYSANYDNTWDGTPNVSGTLGKSKLPPGTYFYILEMKGSGQKPITGFVVLQY